MGNFSGRDSRQLKTLNFFFFFFFNHIIIIISIQVYMCTCVPVHTSVSPITTDLPYSTRTLLFVYKHSNYTKSAARSGGRGEIQDRHYYELVPT